MFGNNTQDDTQTDNVVVNDYNSDLPVGGEDLLSSGAPQNSPINPQPSTQYTEPNGPYTPPSTVNQTADSVSVDPLSTPTPAVPAQNDNLPVSDDLAGIKQNALDELKPLVTHLDQTPEEKFRTTMMMIQASDDKSLLKSAYDQAQQIPDEKVKAQALLDVVNEINYFTQVENQDAQ